MLTDSFGLLLSTKSSTARDAYVAGCSAKLTNRPGAIEAFDCAIAALALILLLPLLGLCWGLIRCTSKGPALFRQQRMGRNGRTFVLYKFRSMRLHRTDHSPSHTVHNDLRITTVGAWLRRFKLDEKPQFWNVLLGNMSVVGPRPHPTPLNLESMHKVDNYMLRHVVKPGITGWAQVNGCRGETRVPGSMQRRVNFDLYYIHRWTFWLDSQIILQTAINVIRGDQNAY